MPTIFITGANRGIGLEFCTQYAAAGWKVIAACRDPTSAAALHAVAGEVTVHALDVDDDAAIAALATQLRDGPPIDVLLNNAGVAETGVGAFGQLDTARWLAVLRTNTISPVKVTEAFLEHVAASAHKKVIAISSRLGSIALNDSGGRYAYRSSKTALNMAWSSLRYELEPRGIACAVVHPGWVRTDMGGEAAPVSPADSVRGVRRVIDELTLATTGKFWNYTGEELPW